MIKGFPTLKVTSCVNIEQRRKIAFADESYFSTETMAYHVLSEGISRHHVFLSGRRSGMTMSFLDARSCQSLDSAVIPCGSCKTFRGSGTGSLTVRTFAVTGMHLSRWNQGTGAAAGPVPAAGPCPTFECDVISCPRMESERFVPGEHRPYDACELPHTARYGLPMGELHLHPAIVLRKIAPSAEH